MVKLDRYRYIDTDRDLFSPRVVLLLCQPSMVRSLDLLEVICNSDQLYFTSDSKYFESSIRLLSPKKLWGLSTNFKKVTSFLPLQGVMVFDRMRILTGQRLGCCFDQFHFIKETFVLRLRSGAFFQRGFGIKAPLYLPPRRGPLPTHYLFNKINSCERIGTSGLFVLHLGLFLILVPHDSSHVH